MENYAVLSIETHLFFARIMKEHALFLEASFPCKDREWISRADFFRRQFEEVLEQAVKIGDGMVSRQILDSQELVTRFTIPAEQKTSQLTGISIDSRISGMEMKLTAGKNTGKNIGRNRALVRMVNRLNERAWGLLNGLIQFKESVLREVGRCRLFTANYPLLLQHILREAKLYRSVLMELRKNRKITRKNLCARQDFWNRIMMEHALFIRGLLDPSEEKLIGTADQFAGEYEKLLEISCRETPGRQEDGQKEKECDCGREEDACGCGRKEKECDCGQKSDLLTPEQLRRKSLEETLRYREFKTAGAQGILNCEIASIILPLLADHVLREANHYIRILESGGGQEDR